MNWQIEFEFVGPLHDMNRDQELMKQVSQKVLESIEEIYNPDMYRWRPEDARG